MNVAFRIFIAVLVLATAAEAGTTRDVFLKNGMVYRGVQFHTEGNAALIVLRNRVDTVQANLIVGLGSPTDDDSSKSTLEWMSSSECDLYFHESREPIDENFDTDVKTIQGPIYTGKFVRSDGPDLIFATSEGTIVLHEDDIVYTSTWTDHSGPGRPLTKKFLVKKYDRLPLLMLACGGAVAAYSLFDQAHEYSRVDYPRSNAYTLYGLGAAVVSCLLLYPALTPTITVIEQPITLLPTPNGVCLTMKF